MMEIVLGVAALSVWKLQNKSNAWKQVALSEGCLIFVTVPEVSRGTCVVHVPVYIIQN